MIYCVTIQAQSGEVIGSAEFKIHADGLDCLGYTMRGKTYPACSPWEVFDRIVQAIDLDNLNKETKSRLLEAVAYTKT